MEHLCPECHLQDPSPSVLEAERRLILRMILNNESTTNTLEQNSKHPPPAHTKAKILIQPVWGGGSWGEILGHEKEKECSRAKFKYLRTKFKIPPAYKSQNSNPTSGGEAGGRFWVMRKRRTAGVEQLQFTEKIITIWIYFFGSLLVLKTGTPPPVPSQPSTS